MNNATALERLKLEKDATPETIEKTYRKLINRYPPEFHPEKFRQYDEAYRFLTSFPRRLELLFAPESGELKVDMTMFNLDQHETMTLLSKSRQELQKLQKLDFLFS